MDKHIVIDTLRKIENLFLDISKKLPEIPKGFKDFLVKAMPWIVIVVAIVSLLAVAGIINILRVASLLPIHYVIMIVIALIIIIISAVLYFLAFQPLSKNKKSGWNKVFYVQLLGILNAITYIVVGDISRMIFALIGSLIGLYLLFQIRDRYIK